MKEILKNKMLKGGSKKQIMNNQNNRDEYIKQFVQNGNQSYIMNE